MNMKNFSGFMVLMLTLLFIMGTSVHAKTTFLHIDSIEKMKPNGIFTIEVYQKGKWQSAGGLFFDKTFRERNMDLSRFLKDDEKARIRIIQKGGGAAHIDSALLGGLARCLLYLRSKHPFRGAVS